MAAHEKARRQPTGQRRRLGRPRYYDRFVYCPECGGRYEPDDFDANEFVFRCRSCGLPFYQNSISSATAIIPCRGQPHQVILITRTTEPRCGRLALPGGMLGYHEDPAVAAGRETREETLLDVEVSRFLCTTLVDYLYRDGHLSILEHAFVTRPVRASIGDRRTDEASAVRFYDVRRLLRTPRRLAFPEQADVLQRYLSSLAPARAPKTRLPPRRTPRPRS